MKREFPKKYNDEKNQTHMDDLIPDIIPDEKKPLEPDFDYDDEYEGEED